MKAIVVGSINKDTTYSLERLPVTGETILANEKYSSIGGKGFNQAIALQRIGFETVFIGALGNDSFANEVEDFLIKEEMTTDGLLRKNADSGEALILVENSGSNMIVPYLAANEMLTPEDIDEKSYLFEDVDVCIMQYEIPMTTVEYVIELCKNKNIKVVIDPAPARKGLSSNSIEAIDYFMPNETELELITGYKVDFQNLEAICQKLVDKGIKRLIVTMGEHGAYYKDANDFIHVPAEKVEVVDTTAAGDTFAGAFVYKIMQGEGVEDAMKFANKMSAVVIGIEGTLAQISKDEFMDKAKAFK